jgi:hypothetical protein
VDQEQISIELDDRPAAEAIKRTNAGLESVENKTKSVVDGMGKQWAVHAETIVRISDRSKASIDRTIMSVQKLADAYGKTEVEKLMATQDQLVQRFKGEQSVIDAVTSSYGKMIAAAKESEAVKAKAAQQSAIDSYERQASLYQKTGSARLEAQRDIELRQYAAPEHEPVRAAIRQSYGQMIDADKAAEAKVAIDAQRSAVDRLVASLEKEAALAGKTGIQRQIAERELLLKEWQHEPKAVDAITASLKRLSAEQEQAAKVHGNVRRLVLGAKDLAEGYSRGAVIEGVDYLMSLRGGGAGAGASGAAGAAGGAATIAGFSAATIAAASFVAVLGSIELAGYKAMKSLAAYGEEIENVHLRTGLAVTEVEQFSFAAKMGGQDVEIYEKMMRGLSEAAAESSKQGDKARETLKSIGVTLRNEAGDLKPTSEVLLEISRGLNKLPEGMQRDAAAMDLFKRSGVEAIPVISGLSANIQKAKEIGLGVTQEDVARWQKYHENLTEASAEWARFARSIKEPLAATVAVSFKFIHDTADSTKIFGALLGATGGLAMDALGDGGAQAKSDQSAWNVVVNAPAKSNFKPAGTGEINGEYVARVRQRQQTDQQIRDFTATQQKDLNYQLRQAEEALNKLPKPELGATTAADLSQYKAAFNRVDQLKEQVKAVQQLREEETKLQAFERQMNEREGSYIHLPTDKSGQPVSLSPGQRSNAYFDQHSTAPNTSSIFAPPSPVDKIFAERDDLVKNGANRDRATGAALIGASAALAKEEQDWQKTWSETVRRGNEEIDKQRKEEQKKAAQDAEEVTKQWIANLRRNMAEVQQIDERNFTRMDAAEGHQQRMVGLLAGPDEELKTLQSQLQIRAQIRQAELQMKELHAGEWDLDKERFGAEMDSLHDRYEFEEKILELKRQQTDEVKSAVEPLVHTLLTRPGDFGKQLGDMLHQAALKPIEEGLTGMISKSITPIVFGSDGQGGISSFAKNAFGGSKGYDQALLKGATDLNSTITAANTAAIQSQTAMWQQQLEFQKAQNRNQGAEGGGQVGWTAAIAPELSRGSIGSGIPGLAMETLRLGSASSGTTEAAVTRAVQSGKPTTNESITSTIRYVESLGAPAAPAIPSISPQVGGVTSDTVQSILKSSAPTPEPFLSGGSSNNVSPHGFKTLGEIASLGFPTSLPGLGGTTPFAPPATTAADSILTSAGSSVEMPALRGISDVDLGGLGSGFTGGAPPLNVVGTPAAPSVFSQVLGIGSKLLGLGGGGQQGQQGQGGILGQILGGGGGEAGPSQGGGFFGKLFGGSTNGGMFGGLRDFVGLGKGGQDLGNGVGINNVLANGTLGQKFTAIGKSNAMVMGGTMLAINGLTGDHAGTTLGTLEGTAGGAMIGFKYGGPIGAAIGAAVGLGIGVGEQLAGVESPTNEAKRLVKQIYSVSIDTATAKQIVSIAQQKYAGHVSLAVRDPDIRKMIMLYSEATGQKMPLDSTTPRSASLVEQAGKLFQSPTYQDGTAYTFRSSLPVAGGYATANYPSPSSLVLHLDGRSAADLLEGRIANTVTPSYVQDQWSQAANSSNGRLANSALIQQPGLIVN